jgi:hypothetical protein
MSHKDCRTSPSNQVPAGVRPYVRRSACQRRCRCCAARVSCDTWRDVGTHGAEQQEGRQARGVVAHGKHATAATATAAVKHPPAPADAGAAPPAARQLQQHRRMQSAARATPHAGYSPSREAAATMLDRATHSSSTAQQQCGCGMVGGRSCLLGAHLSALPARSTARAQHSTKVSKSPYNFHHTQHTRTPAGAAI